MQFIFLPGLILKDNAISIFVIVLIIAFQVSIFIHILYLSSYLSNKSSRALKGFLLTTITDMILGMTLAVCVMIYPWTVRQLKLDIILTIESGLFFSFMVFVKARITVRIFKRAKDPENYHYNYFGKKVYSGAIVTKKELAVYFLTIPFTLFIGAYFYFLMVKMFSS